MTDKALLLGQGGIGAALRAALEERGAAVTALSRKDGLDFLDPDAALACLEQAAGTGPFDLIFDATGALDVAGSGPEKTINAIDANAMAQAFKINAIGPALILSRFDALAPEEGRCVFASLSARVGSIGDNRLGGWISYRASKAALNQIIRTAAIEIKRKRPEAICAALHPGTVRTALSARFVRDRDVFTPEDAAQKLLKVVDALTPDDTGGFYAYDGSRIEW